KTVAYERTQVIKVLRSNGGALPHSTSFAVFTELGIQIHPNFTTDGNALAAALDDETIRLRTLNQAHSQNNWNGNGPADCQGDSFEIATERRQLSLQALQTIAAHEAGRPGRKLVVWISPGWPLLSQTGVSNFFTSVQNRQMFASIVSVSTQLRQ